MPESRGAVSGGDGSVRLRAIVRRLGRALAFLIVAFASGCTAPPRPDGFYIAPKRKKSAVAEETQTVRRRRPGDQLQDLLYGLARVRHHGAHGPAG